MPTIKTKQILTPKHLGNSVAYLPDADHPAHLTCTLGSVTILNGQPVEDFVGAVLNTTRLYNATVDGRDEVTTLATAYYFNFSAGSKLTHWEKAAYSSRMERILCWDRLAAKCWHDKDNGAADLNLIPSNVIAGAIAPRRTRTENIMSILRGESDKVVASLNELRGKRGIAPIPTVADARSDAMAQNGNFPKISLAARLAGCAKRHNIRKAEVHHLPKLLPALGLVEGNDWEIDFLMRLRVTRPRRKGRKTIVTVIPVNALLAALNTLLGQGMTLNTTQNQPKQRIQNANHSTDKDQKSQYQRPNRDSSA